MRTIATIWGPLVLATSYIKGFREAAGELVPDLASPFRSSSKTCGSEMATRYFPSTGLLLRNLAWNWQDAVVGDLSTSETGLLLRKLF